MLQQTRHDAAAGTTRRIPGLPSDLLATYNGLVAAGATGPASARDLTTVSKLLRTSKRNVEDHLHKLEGKGLVAHQTAKHQTSWYARAT